MRTAVLLILVAVAIVALPLVAPAYYVTLMLPFMAYAVVLLGLNLLFGYTGLVSFGHALFISIGAYTGAVLTTRFGMLQMELILVAAALTAALVAAPVGALCVRYGMQTLPQAVLIGTDGLVMRQAVPAQQLESEIAAACAPVLMVRYH